MLRLTLSNEPHWLDLGHGVRLLVEPLTAGLGNCPSETNPRVISPVYHVEESF